MRYAETLVKPQTLRSAVELKTKHLPTPVQEAVTRSLSHSMTTAQKHYRANDPKSGHLAFETIRGIVSGKEAGHEEVQTEQPQTGSLSRQPKRRRYTDEETEIIRAGCLLLSNHQRPGAVANATLTEWAASKATVVGRKEYKTFYVTTTKRRLRDARRSRWQRISGDFWTYTSALSSRRVPFFSQIEMDAR